MNLYLMNMIKKKKSFESKDLDRTSNSNSKIIEEKLKAKKNTNNKSKPNNEDNMNGTTKSGRSIRNVIYLEGGSGESGDSDQDEKLSKKSPRNRKKEIEILSDPESDAKQKDNTEKKNDLNKVRLTRARASDEKRDKHKRRLKSDSESDLSINSKTKKEEFKGGKGEK